MSESVIGPQFDDLVNLFPDPDGPPDVEIVSPSHVVPPYHQLLVHSHHMTVAVEEFYRVPVNVRVLASRHEGDYYSRKILLTLEKSGKIVQYGAVRINLALCEPDVRAAIESEKIPLGRVLIQHNVLRSIHPTSFLKVAPHPTICQWFGLTEGVTTWGRLGVIFCDERPAIEVLEILAPV